MTETQLNLHNELKIPNYDAIAKRILDTPLILRNAILVHPDRNGLKAANLNQSALRSVSS